MRLPMIALRGLVAFPNTSLQFDLKRDILLKALNNAVENHTPIFLMPQSDPLVDDVDRSSFAIIGTIAEIKHVINLPGQITRVLTKGKKRGRVLEFEQYSPYIAVDVEEVFTKVGDPIEYEAIFRATKELAEDYVKLNPKLGVEIAKLLTYCDEADVFSDMISHTLPHKYKGELIEQLDGISRYNKIYSILLSEIDILKAEAKIGGRVKSQIDKSQKEYYLREQIKAIHEELGDTGEETDALKEKLDKLVAPDDVKAHLQKEWRRMSGLNSMSPEMTILRTYLEWATDLPWGKYSDDNVSLKHAREVLDEDHYALDKLKERIVEYLAVRQMTDKLVVGNTR